MVNRNSEKCNVWVFCWPSIGFRYSIISPRIILSCGDVQTLTLTRACALTIVSRSADSVVCILWSWSRQGLVVRRPSPWLTTTDSYIAYTRSESIYILCTMYKIYNIFMNITVRRRAHLNALAVFPISFDLFFFTRKYESTINLIIYRVYHTTHMQYARSVREPGVGRRTPHKSITWWPCSVRQWRRSTEIYFNFTSILCTLQSHHGHNRVFDLRKVSLTSQSQYIHTII